MIAVVRSLSRRSAGSVSSLFRVDVGSSRRVSKDRFVLVPGAHRLWKRNLSSLFDDMDDDENTAKRAEKSEEKREAQKSVKSLVEW